MWDPPDLIGTNSNVLGKGTALRLQPIGRVGRAGHAIAHFNTVCFGGYSFSELDDYAGEIRSDPGAWKGKVRRHFPVTRIQGDSRDMDKHLARLWYWSGPRSGECEDPRG
jgi:hypothetical protein